MREAVRVEGTGNCEREMQGEWELIVEERKGERAGSCVQFEGRQSRS